MCVISLNCKNLKKKQYNYDIENLTKNNKNYTFLFGKTEFT